MAALALAACEAPATEPASAPEGASAEAAQAGFAPRTVGTHSVKGVLLAFEDVSWPAYYDGLEVGPAGAAVGDEGNLKLGSLDPEVGGPVAPATIQPLIGKPVEVRYTVTTEHRMVDLLINGASILPRVEGEPAPPADAKTIQGVLGGADTESGDLPSELTVKAPDGTSVTFEAFVAGEMTSANGRTVTLRYEDDLATTLESIAPASQS
ncbi:hypothetical protein HZ989_11475 [Brevundimonas sp. AJA228-03]|uniref:hypothetical protein n=1 Tax=Brevundimonas sp. AJA228-03 TaxID=2752515 RepID=UPI001ADF1291|nr:hypothetical protein [Brevundimonas sp. AJA228-03]QTN18852.1 hypothetical protein HZ989_11475 [Brevundimonas sp. AJA228-03]